MGLIHRDIKPANCLVDKNKVVKLLDMGLARLIDDEASLTLDNNENVLGTADYLAPEQALNSHKADVRSDIYSLGCTFYFLVTGHPPFPDGSISERLLKHQVERAPSILKDRPDAPPILVHICETMMSKKAHDRYQSADEVSERLAEWLADRGREVGDSGKNLLTGSGGVGSDVFRRFAQSMNRAGDSGGKSGAGKSGKQLVTQVTATAVEEEDEIGLAPLEEEKAKPVETTFLKTETKPEDALKATRSDPQPLKRQKSLVEEAFELEAQKETNKPTLRARPGEIDPLRPPGYSGPSYGTPGWVYAMIGIGVVVVIGIVLVVAMS
jgi:serine/threonine protein kinase